jgi:sigma-E factor negative regulatory protein RseB
MRQLVSATLLAFATYAAGALAAEQGAEHVQPEGPHAWLMEMHRAFSELNYDGVFSFYGGDDLASLRVVHMELDGVQRERLVHLNGAPREIVRNGEEVACILMPGDDLLALEGSIPSGPFARAFVRRYDQISDHYGVSFYGEDRVAGRQAVRIAVSPHDADRFGYRLWLDKQTRLLLRSELIDAEGRRLEIFQFNQLLLGDAVDPAAVEPSGRDGSLVSHLTLAQDRAVAVAAPAIRWGAGWLPAGFSMAAADVRRTPSQLKAVDTMMYSDGLAAFSVFVEDMPPAGAASMVSRKGATVAVTQVLAGESPDSRHLVTLVGELPTGTAQRIAQSIRRVLP